MKLSHEGICPCGGRLKANQWELKDGTKKGTTRCVSCGRCETKLDTSGRVRTRLD